MAESTVTDSISLLGQSPAERDEHGITAEDVTEALLDVVEHGSRREKVFTECTFPRLDLEYQDVDGVNKHPLVFERCTFEDGIVADHADVKLPVRFEACTIGGVSLEQTRFEYDVSFDGSTFTGAVDAFEARFDRDAEFTDVTFRAPVDMDEAAFDDDASFDGATFEESVSFRGAAFSGTSNELEDNASFEAVVFDGEANFRQATFRYSTFERATFSNNAQFERARFGGDVTFVGATFAGEADFDETDFERDAAFDGAEFRASAVFRGAEFEGGSRALTDDARFVNVEFRDDANFRDTQFRYVTFEGTTFGGHAMFEEARFAGDADVRTANFRGEADFDEARFAEDADFSGARFERAAVFRGAEFEGEANHLEENAMFEGVEFDEEVDFDNAKFTSANFTRTRFGGVVDFFGAEFRDEIAFLAEATDEDTFVDFTDAVIVSGTITQPTDNWVRYDFTLASLGDVSLEASVHEDHDELLDYVRFCNTEFDEFDGHEFDFSAHTSYFDRHDWRLHTFVESGDDGEYALPMTPETIETTYLRAKRAASSSGFIKAAGEFRVKRQQYARRKYLDIARNPTVDARTRFTNLNRAAENYFLGVTCGHGMRLVRIGVVFLLFPIFPALLYAFGGDPFLTSAGQLSSVEQLATQDGRAILFEIIYFSYITFLTIGYGGIAPEGALARLLAGLEVYVSIILGGLVLYALIKRSEL